MRELLRVLWPVVVDGAVTFWFRPGSRSVHVPLAEALAMTDEDEAVMCDPSLDAFFGLGLRRAGLSPSQQGGKRSVVSMPGFAVDVDVLDERAHRAKNLPETEEEALSLLEPLPEPTALVSSGNGVHAYFAFPRAEPIDSIEDVERVESAYRDFQDRVIVPAQERGLHVDRTATVQRQWRAPGSTNRKTGRPCRLLSIDGSRRYSISALAGRDPRTLLAGVRRALAARRLGDELAGEARALSEGRSFARAGERDATMQRLASLVAWLPESAPLDVDDLAELFRESVSIWAAEPGANKTADEEMAKVRDKLARARSDLREVRAREAARTAGVAAALAPAVTAPRPAPVAAARENVELEDPRRALIQRQTTFYAYDFRANRYSHPLVRSELGPYLRDAWEDAPDEIERTTIKKTKDGIVESSKTLDGLIRDYCTVATDVLADMTIPASFYDEETRVFHEAVAVPRVTEAREDPRIDEWIRLLAGPLADKVLDWLASVTRLDKPLSALYLKGRPGTGKGMLTNGIARIWRRGAPTPLAMVLGDHGDAFLECPLLWIDEGLPARRGNVSAEIRSLIGLSSMVINPKYLAPKRVKGCPRLIIAANNDSVLALGDERHEADDLEALVQRFLHVNVSPETAEWVSERNRHGELWDDWVERDGIAMHCLHLAKTREVRGGDRFLVQGAETSMHRRLVMQGTSTSLVYEWIARFCTEPGRLRSASAAEKKLPGATIGSGRITVATQCVVDAWHVYMPEDYRRPSTTRVGGVLRQVAERQERDEGRRRVFVVRPELVLEWIRTYGVGDEEQVAENLKTEVA